MKKILNNIFTQSDNSTYSYMRIIVIPLLLVPFTYKMIESADTLKNIGIGAGVFGGCIGILAFFSKFIEDGTVKSVINDVVDKFKK